MITCTQGEHTFENHKDLGVVAGLYEIRAVKKISKANRMDYGIIMGTGVHQFPTSDYVYIDANCQLSAGDVKPYGVIILSGDYACILYDLALACEAGGSAITDTGFVVIQDDDAGKGNFQYSRIMPTRYFSNAFAKLYGVCPSGVVALNDRVIATYDGDLDFTSISADYIAYDGILPVGAFDVHACIAPTLFIKSKDYDEAYYHTVAHILQTQTYYADVPPTSGFLKTDFSPSKLTSLIAELKGFKTLTNVSDFLLREKPQSSATSLTGVIRSVVDETALVDDDVTRQIVSGILLESHFIALLDSRDFSKLSYFGPGGCYLYYRLNDDFTVMLDKFNAKYQELKSKVVRTTYARLTSFMNQAVAALNDAWTDSYRNGMVRGFNECIDAFEASLKDNFFRDGLLDVVKGIHPRNVQVDLALLKRLCVRMPSCMTPTSDRTKDTEMEEEIKAKIYFYITSDLANMIDQYQQGKMPTLIDDLSKAYVDDADDPKLNGKSLFDTENLLNSALTAIEEKAYVHTENYTRALTNGLVDTAAAAANIDNIVRATSDKYNGSYIVWFFVTKWNQEPSYYDVQPKRNIVTGVDYIVNPVTKKGQFTFSVLSGCIGAYYNRQSQSRVNENNAHILRGELPKDWTVTNEGSSGIRIGYHLDQSYGGGWSCNMSYACYSKHYVRSPWFDVSEIVFEDPNMPYTSNVKQQTGTVFARAFEKFAADGALEYIRPMIDSISAVAEYCAIGFVGCAHVRIGDVTKIGHFSNSYITALQTAVDEVCKSLEPYQALKLTRFVSSLATALKLAEREPFYYLTAAGMKLGRAYADPSAPPIALVYGADYSI